MIFIFLFVMKVFLNVELEKSILAFFATLCYDFQYVIQAFFHNYFDLVVFLPTKDTIASPLV